MMVFNLSAQRSGTQSMHAFFWAHGIASEHWCGPGDEGNAAAATFGRLGGPDQAELLWHAFAAYYGRNAIPQRPDRAFGDFPTPLIYPAARRALPDALFVMTVRDPAAWVQSVRGHIGGKPLTFCESIFYRDNTGRAAGSIDDYGDAELERAYRTHTARVTAEFADEPHRLLALELDDPNLGARIGSFAGFAQTSPFPRNR